MSDQKMLSAIGPNLAESYHIDTIAQRLQEALDLLTLNADHLSGDLFHPEDLFRAGESVRLDVTIKEIIAELRSLAGRDAQD